MRDLAWALDPVAFAQEALGFTALDPWQVRTLRWSGDRLLLNVHRQGGKSTIAAVLALHRALYTPKSLVLLVSPSLRQSSELFRVVRDLFTRVPGAPDLVEDNRTSLATAEGSRIVSLPSSEGTVRGYAHVDLIVEDEAARVPDELYRAIRPMLAVSGGRLMLMSTPAGKRGHFYEEWMQGVGWERVLVRAEECPRIHPDFLRQERLSLGDLWYRQEYECEFVEDAAQVFGDDWIRRAITNEVKPLWESLR
jgi:hypothetical protein